MGKTTGVNITESQLLLADNATANASATKHGFLPKLPDDDTKVLDGKGEWVDMPEGGSEPYLVYTALLTQSDVDAPTAIILQNTMGDVPTFQFLDSGSYSLDFVAELLTIDKTGVLLGSVDLNLSLSAMTGASAVLDGDEPTKRVRIKTMSDVTTFSNNILNRTMIEIRVYP